MAQDRHAEAETILAALVRDGDGTGPVLNNLAEVFRHDTSRLEDAERLVQQALAADRENAVFYLDTYAMILSQQGAPDRAREVLTRARASELPVEVASVLDFHLGQVLVKAGDSRGGLAALARALAAVDEEREPRRACEYALAFAQAALAAGETVRARAELAKVIALDQGTFGWQAKEILAGMPAE
jgi:Tfp pilus assembly protein PilF